MPKILILFYSRTGNTAALADAVAEGARSVRFAEVTVRRIDDLASPEVVAAVPGWAESRAALASRYQTLGGVEELADHDALILGAPSRCGIMAAELKHLLDQTEPLSNRGALVDKVGSAFASVGTDHGGRETTLWSIMTPMANLGMILVPPGHPDPAVFAGGRRPSGAPTEQDLAAARHQGKHVVEVAGWVAHAKSHHHH